MKNQEASSIAKRMSRKFRLEKTLHSEKGSNFMPNPLRNMCTERGITRLSTTAGHKQQNAMIEPINAKWTSVLKINSVNIAISGAIAFR